MNNSNWVVTRFMNTRWTKIALAAGCAMQLADAGAVPITTISSQGGLHSIFGTSANTNRYDDFTLQDSRSSVLQFAKFDSSLGTLLGAQLMLTSATSHPTRTLSLPEVSGLPVALPFGALAQDTERDLHGPFNLYAYYDARVSYRADYRLTVDPLNTDLFSATAAEAAFGSCARVEDLFGDIGNTNPYCMAGNNGSPVGNYNYTWGPLSGSSLSQFIGADLLRFNTSMTGDAYGHCDDDVGDYCRVNLAMNWNYALTLSYTYEPVTPGTGGGEGGDNGNGNGGGDPVGIPEPAALGMMGIALLALGAVRRRRILKA
ncbi:MAG TPA: PEP-CTERM sorting domain-containing protein [Steroidobacteraceae bacterium]|nr:PEP-CTERM sorting domain-containing protein [Steroidobacteraceae bacterium]